MALGAMAPNYSWLLCTRIGLGAVTAGAAPAVASLTGDVFPAGERGKVYGYVLSGELLGAAVGYVVCGTLASVLSWRWAFGVLTPPALLLAGAIHRLLSEPERGRSGPLTPQGGARKAVTDRDVEPIQAHVVVDRRDMRLPAAVRYVLSIATNRWLIVASAIGYFFFAGMRTFALVFARGHFSLGQGSATAVLFLAGMGAVAGVLLSGRIADRLIVRGRLDARILVGAVAYLFAVLCLLPVLATTSLLLAVPLLMLAGAGLSAPNPPLDAARLDIVSSWLWGRAEACRRLCVRARRRRLRSPSVLWPTPWRAGRVSSSARAPVSHAAADGVTWAFGIMLAPLALSGVVLLVARRRYPADVATAAASERPEPRPRQPRHTRRQGRPRDARTIQPAD